MSLEKLPGGPFFGRGNVPSFLASFASLVIRDGNSREHEVVCHSEESKRDPSCVRLVTWQECWSALLGGLTGVLPGRIYFPESELDQVPFWLNVRPQ